MAAGTSRPHSYNGAVPTRLPPPSWSGSSSTAALRGCDYRDHRALAGLEHVVRRLAIAAAYREHLELLQLLGDVQDLELGDRSHGREPASWCTSSPPRRSRTFRFCIRA